MYDAAMYKSMRIIWQILHFLSLESGNILHSGVYMKMSSNKI